MRPQTTTPVTLAAPGTVSKITTLFLPLLLLTTAGCRYDGSFMQMDSNAPFPFFGFQLAVDSGVRPPSGNGAGHGDTAGKLRPEDIVPLRENFADEFDVPLPRLRRQPESGAHRRTPALLVRSRGPGIGYR